MSETIKKNITSVNDSSFQACKKIIDDLFPIIKPEKDAAINENEAFYSNKKANADKLSENLKKIITPSSDSSFKACKKIIDDLFPVINTEKVTTRNGGEAFQPSKRTNSYKR